MGNRFPLCRLDGAGMFGLSTYTQQTYKQAYRGGLWMVYLSCTWFDWTGIGDKMCCLNNTEPELYGHFTFFKVLEQFSLSCSKITGSCVVLWVFLTRILNICNIVCLGFVALTFALFKNLNSKVTLGNYIKLKACDKCKLITSLLMDGYKNMAWSLVTEVYSFH